MKLSTINWLPKAIALPLFITIINIANSVSAEQIDRSRAKLVDFLPSVTDFTLMVPVGVDILPSEDREQYSSIEPFWSKPSQNNSSTTVIKERSGKTRLTTRRKNKSLATINTSLGADRQVIKTKAIHRNKVLTSTRPGADRFTIVRDSQKLKSSSRKLTVGSRLPLNRIISGTVPEVGKTFIGIFPKFETGRNGLGIHLDRSFNQRNGYDGTAGCIGITTTTDRDAINEFITKYHPHNLVVKIGILED
ncbi:MAG: hypothetical protein LH613_00085 [Chamaesiphon sp.]|nr:hypothetical protein [Chamaesiphon sp.]